MKKYTCIILLFFFYISPVVSQTEDDAACAITGYVENLSYPILLDKHKIYMLSENKKIDYYGNKCDDTETFYLQQGIAPIVLYNSDISQLQIKEIEIKDSINKEPYTFNVYFGKTGLFNSFSLCPVLDKRHEVLSCSMQSSCLPTVIYKDYEYRNCFSEFGPETRFIVNEDYSYKEPPPSDNFGDIQLQFHISSSMDRDDYNFEYLSKIKILPFFGKNGYMYIDSLGRGKYCLKNNSINYSLIGTDYRMTYDNRYNEIYARKYFNNYGILKKTQSDSINVELYEVEDKDLLTPLLSRKTINTIQKDTFNLLYYCYGDDPYSEYVSDRSGGIVTRAFYYIYYIDDIYNKNRWLGFTDDENDLSAKETRSLWNCEFESKIITETFSSQNVTKVSKKNFFINGQNGYNYLLKSYNNKQVSVKEEYEDENGAEYKLQKEIAEIQELPDTIIVQITLTDFWYIQLTE